MECIGYNVVDVYRMNGETPTFIIIEVSTHTEGEIQISRIELPKSKFLPVRHRRK